MTMTIIFALLLILILYRLKSRLLVMRLYEVDDQLFNHREVVQLCPNKETELLNMSKMDVLYIDGRKVRLLMDEIDMEPGL